MTMTATHLVGTSTPPATTYPYTHQLERMASRALKRDTCLPMLTSDIASPIQIQFWHEHLQHHPDKRFAQLILTGLEKGFHIGFNANSRLRAATFNHTSAREHPEVVSAYIQDELTRGQVGHVGPQELIDQWNIHLSPLGAIPKKGNSGKWRLIMDLSSPKGLSVNDGILREECTFHYVSVDLAVMKLRQLGTGALMAKMDVQRAYRNIPVAPGDRGLLGFQWQSQIYIDKALPFGLRSAPLIFSAVADALLWIMERRGVSWAIHYVDDFLTIGGPHSNECHQNMAIMHDTCAQAGLPLEPSKTQGPLSVITFLGIELDSTTMEIRLPQDKLTDIIEKLAYWRDRTACIKRDLLSLIGILAHASKVVKSSRIFLRRLIDLSTKAEDPSHFIRLNIEARSDIEWWFQFIRQWNGVTMIPPRPLEEVKLISDASGRWGCGAFWDCEWFQLPWGSTFQDTHISAKELTPIVVATAIWGKAWRGRLIHVLSDNMAAVAAINNQTSSLKESAHLLRCLAFLTAHHQCELRAQHLPGRHNALADALSRDNVKVFHLLHPQARNSPTPLPEQLIRLLITERPDWTSHRWTELWTATWSRV